MKRNESIYKAKLRHARILNLTAKTIERQLKEEFDKVSKIALDSYKDSQAISPTIYAEHSTRVYIIAFDGLMRGQELGSTGTLTTFVKSKWLTQLESDVLAFKIKLRRRQYAVDNATYISRKVAETTQKTIDAIIEKSKIKLELNTKERNSFIDDLIAAAMAEAESTNTWRTIISAFTWAHSANEQGSLDAAKAANDNYPMELFKVWITVNDGKVRETHIPMHKISVPVNDFFLVSGYKMTGPGDMSAPVSLWLNCRCIKLFETAEPDE